VEGFREEGTANPFKVIILGVPSSLTA